MNSAGNLIDPEDTTDQTLDNFYAEMDLCEIKEIILKELSKDIRALYVFKEICAGGKNREIAQTLNLEVREVENIKKRIRTVINRIIKRLGDYKS